MATLFRIGIFAKAIDGALEIVGGVLLFFLTPDRTYRVIRVLTENELHGSAHEFVATHGVHAVQQLSTGTRTFASIYLLAHGAAKLGLVTGLLLKKRPVYPVAIGAFLLFLGYQIYRYTQSNSRVLLVLSALDLFVIVMTALEYRRLTREHGFSSGRGAHKQKPR
jgi:uncharacterized membrane protein